MTRQEFKKIAAALRTYYSREPNLIPNGAAMELWYLQLQDLSYELTEAALNRWVASHKWSPSIADLREEAAEIRSGGLADWGSGWEQVCRAIRKFGIYAKDDALASMDDLTRRTVERLGFGELCRSENVAADRANFRLIYEQLAERERQNAQMPPWLTAKINGMIEKAGETLEIDDRGGKETR